MLLSPPQLGLQHEVQGKPSYFGFGHCLSERVDLIVMAFN
jgi:hypothetical protein